MWAINVKQVDAKWKRCNDLPGPKRAFPALAACGKYLYLFGGMCTDPNNGSQIVMQDSYRYDPKKDIWTRLKDLPWKGYAWSASSIDESHVILAGRADGQIHKDIYLIDITDMSTRIIGESVIQTTTAPLITLAKNEYWLIAGEPDSNKNRTNKITTIIFK
jgi:N-acetylneuraminic acid mutarotase